MRLADLEPEFAAVPGTVSVWCAPLGAGPWYARAEHVPHYAASAMKVAVLLAAQHAHQAGTLDLDRPVPATDRFASAAPGAPDYVLAHAPDDDPAPWVRLRRSRAPPLPGGVRLRRAGQPRAHRLPAPPPGR